MTDLNHQPLAYKAKGFAVSILNLAEAVRFELTVPFDTLVFKTRAIDHSTTLPKLGAGYRVRTDDILVGNETFYH